MAQAAHAATAVLIEYRGRDEAVSAYEQDLHGMRKVCFSALWWPLAVFLFCIFDSID